MRRRAAVLGVTSLHIPIMYSIQIIGLLRSEVRLRYLEVDLRARLGQRRSALNHPRAREDRRPRGSHILFSIYSFCLVTDQRRLLLIDLFVLHFLHILHFLEYVLSLALLL